MHPVQFVGAGPGSTDLITVRGARALAMAEVVLADALIDPGFRALAPAARWIDVGKRGHRPSTPQAQICDRLVAEASAGWRVVRLKGGDPSVFGRLEEELQALDAAGLQSEVIPGVTAALAAAAVTRRPLTRRGHGRRLTLCTAMSHDGALESPGQTDTLVIYMGGHDLPGLQRRLGAAGWPADTPVLVVSNAGTGSARSSSGSLGSLGQQGSVHQGQATVVTVGVGATQTGIPRPYAQRSVEARSL